MTAKKKGPIRLDQITPEEKMKYEVAEELDCLIKCWQRDGNLYHPRKPDGLEGSWQDAGVGSSKALWKRSKSNKSITNVN